MVKLNITIIVETLAHLTGEMFDKNVLQPKAVYRFRSFTNNDQSWIKERIINMAALATDIRNSEIEMNNFKRL